MKKENTVEEVKPVEEVAVEEPVSEPKSAPKTITGFVVASKLNVREEPSIDAKIIGILSKDTKVEFVKFNKEWVSLATGGYCMKQFIKN